MIRRHLAALLLAPLAPVAGAAGMLDSTFSDDGVLTLETSIAPTSSDLLRNGLIDSNGRYVGVGSAGGPGDLSGLVLRVLPGAQPDPGFGSNGIVRVPRLPGWSSVNFFDVVEQPDGKLVVAGKASNGPNGPDPGRAYVCRLLPNGTLDPAFGAGGCTQPAFAPASNVDNLVAIALQDDGRIVFAGSTDAAANGQPYEYVVGRLDEDGQYDRCFGDLACQSGGLLITPEPDADLPLFQAADVAIAPNGRIVVAGRARGATSNEFAVIRLLPGGAVDAAGFGNSGHRMIGFDQGGVDADEARTLLVRDDGSIVLAGVVNTDTGNLAGVAALNAFGTLIQGFGTQGRVITFFNDVSPVHVPTRLIEQSDGKLLLAGYTDNDHNSGESSADCGIARFDAMGQEDEGFGFDGVNNLDGGLGEDPVQPDACFGVAADGRRIVLFGLRRQPGQNDFDALLMRLDQDDLFRDGFED